MKGKSYTIVGTLNKCPYRFYKIHCISCLCNVMYACVESKNKGYHAQSRSSSHRENTTTSKTIRRQRKTKLVLVGIWNHVLNFHKRVQRLRARPKLLIRLLFNRECHVAAIPFASLAILISSFFSSKEL